MAERTDIRLVPDGPGEIPEPPSDATLARVLRLLEPARRLVNPRVYGGQHLPSDRGALLVGNHTLIGLLDAPLLCAELEASAQTGAVGPKLLFEDDSLQHAGLFFGRDYRGRWINQHYHKGMPRDFAPACLPRAVPGVTGACLLMPAALATSVSVMDDQSRSPSRSPTVSSWSSRALSSWRCCGSSRVPGSAAIRI